MTDEVDYNQIFEQIEKEKKKEEGTLGETDTETGMTPIYEDGELIGYEDSDGKMHYETGHKERGRKNIAYNYAAQMRLRRREAENRRLSQRATTVKVEIDERDYIDTELIHLTPENSRAVIVNDAETLSKLTDEFEILAVGLNGFAVVDILDGRFEDLRDFAKEHKIRMYDFPLATYYLNMLTIGDTNAAPAGAHKFCVLPVKDINEDDMNRFDKILFSDILLPDAKNSLDMFICTANYIGFDKEVIIDLVKEQLHEEDLTNVIKNYVLLDEIEDFVADRPALRSEIVKMQRKVANTDLEQIIMFTGNNELIDFTDSVLEILLDPGKSMLGKYIEIQLEEDKRKNNYQRLIDFWDNTDYNIRYMCKTGAVRGEIIQLEDINLKNNAVLSKFLKKNKNTEDKLKIIAKNYKNTENKVKKELKLLDKEIKRLSNEVNEVRIENKLAKSAYKKDILQNKEYLELKEKLRVIRLRYSKKISKEEKAELHNTRNIIGKRIDEINQSYLTYTEFIKCNEAYNDKYSEYAGTIARSNFLNMYLRHRDEKEYLATAFYQGRLLLKRELDSKFFRSLKSLSKKEDFKKQLTNLILRYEPLRLEDIVTDSISGAKEQLQKNLVKIRGMVEDIKNTVKVKNKSEITDKYLENYLYEEEYMSEELKKAPDLKQFYIENIRAKLSRLHYAISSEESVLQGAINPSYEHRKRHLRIKRLDNLLTERLNLYFYGDVLIKNVATSLSNRGYLDICETEHMGTMFISKGRKYNELEAKGDTCPMGLSSNWYTPKIRFLPHGTEFSQHFFGNPENRIITGEEIPTKIEFHDYDNSFILHLRGNENVKLTTKQATYILTNIETYALEAICNKRVEDHQVPKIIRATGDMIYILGEDSKPYSLRDTYNALKAKVYS